MTEPGAATAAVPAKGPSFWEDLIDIFYAPSDVFRRRQNASVWPPLLVVSIAIALISVVTFDATMAPIFDAEFARNSEKLLRNNPQMTQEMLDRSKGITMMGAKWGGVIFTPIIIFVLAVVAWLVGKLVGSAQTFQAAMIVVAYAYVVRVVGTVLVGAQGLIMDPANLTSQYSISLGPARFFDPNTTNPVQLALLGRLDIITLWVTVLLAIGLYATGKVSKSRAVTFGVLIWIVGSLPLIRNAYALM